MSGHTPGPWKLHGGHNDVVSANVTSIGRLVAAPYGIDDAERDANAQLIAAAPALADALGAAVIELGRLAAKYRPDDVTLHVTVILYDALDAAGRLQ